MKTPIIDELNNYIKESKLPCSMPGHKRGRAFNNIFKNILLHGDITEIDGLDNLHKPEGCIKESLTQLKEVYGSYKSYFLINGSSCGNLIMMNAFFNEGDKIIVERNCHKSIFNGIILKKLTPVYVKNSYSEKLNLYGGIDYSNFIEILEAEEDIKGVVITYPNYYGICVNLKKIIKECKKRNIVVLVDCAHGSHFEASDKLPESPIALGADCVVMSAHKTLPSLTQTSYMHLNNKNFEKNIDLYFSILSSTSPSYLFMASLEYAYVFMKEKGQEGYNHLINKIDELKNEINITNKGLRILDNNIIKQEFSNDYNFDSSRIVINLDPKYNGSKLYKYLLDNNIQPEMYDESNVVLITTPFNYDEEIDEIKKVLLELDCKKIEKEQVILKNINIPNRVLSPWEVIGKTKELIHFEQADGKIAGENIVPYPPGIPLLVMGEKITNKEIESLKYAIDNNINIIGINDNNINIVQEDI